MGAPIGNTNGSNKNRLFNKSLRRSVKQGKGDANKLRKITDRLCLEAENGSIPAIAIVADRLDGKAVQGVTVNEGQPITIVQRVIVNQAVDSKEVIEGQVIQEAIEVSED